MSAVIPDPALTDWIPLGGVGGGGSMIALQEITPVGGVLDFQNIPQGYASLIIDVIARDNVATSVTAMGMRLNNVSTSVYYGETLNAIAAAASAAETGAQGSARVGIAVAATADAADMVAFTRIQIPWYARTDLRKVWRSLGGEGYGVATGKTSIRDRAGWWDSSAAINRITLGSFESAGTLIAPSRAILYGLAAPGVTLPSYGPFYGTSPPASPIDGMEWIYPVDASGTLWRFRYNAAAATYKWEFVGGPDALASISGAAETTTNTAGWVDLATVGPRVIVPRAGDYMAAGGTGASHNTAGGTLAAGIAKGATTPPQPTMWASFYAANAWAVPPTQSLLFTGLVAGDDLRLRYYNLVAGTATFIGRWLRVTPVRVA